MTKFLKELDDFVEYYSIENDVYNLGFSQFQVYKLALMSQANYIASKQKKHVETNKA